MDRRPWGLRTPEERRRAWHSAAALLIGAGAVMVLLLHPLRGDVDPARHYVSEYGNEAWSWMLTVALVFTATGLLALASGLRETARTQTGSRLLEAAGLLLVIAAFVSTDRRGGEVEAATIGGLLHGWAAIGAFILLVLAMLSLSPALGDGRRRWGLDRLGVAAGVVAAATPLVAYLLVPEAHGIRQRLFLAIVFAWLIAVALHLRAPEPAWSRRDEQDPPLLGELDPRRPATG
jgi:hypothetical protein